MELLPLRTTIGKERDAFLAELIQSILKWLYHAAEKEKISEGHDLENVHAGSVGFRSEEYRKKLVEIYKKYPRIKDKEKIFDDALRILCDYELIVAVTADNIFRPSPYTTYRITESGCEETRKWFKTNGNPII